VYSDIKTLERPSIRHATGSEINTTLKESSAFNVHVLHEGAVGKIGDVDVSLMYRRRILCTLREGDFGVKIKKF
jgi:hypothetical protein